VCVKGVFVSRVAEDSVCYQAGLRVGDKLVSVLASFSSIL